MRVTLPFVLAAGLAVGAVLMAQGQGTDASAVLAAAREALGGDKNFAAVKSFVATGRTRQVRGDNLVPIEFEISCQFPDRYVRRDEIPAQESGPTSAGFNGDRLIQFPVPAPPPPPPAPGARAGAPAPSAPAPAAAAGRAVAPAPAAPAQGAPPVAPSAAAPTPAGPATTPTAPAAGAPAPPSPGGAPGSPPAAPPDPRATRVTTLKQDFVKLTLGMFAGSFPGYPLTFTLDGQAQAPQGTADIVEVKGPGTFALKFFINSQTHLPIMVSWTTPATNVVMSVPGQKPPDNLPPGSIVVQAPAPPPPTATKEEQAKYAKDVQELRKKALAGAKPIENRVYYADYRDVGNGLKFPFRLRRAVAGETVEETNFDAFRINARIDPRKFEALR
jgi:hypothetical protein